MKRVSLVCTVHDESGLATASALHEILERLRPEVIFLEVPPDALDRYFAAGTQRNLEAAAILRYRQTNHVELVPVDLPTPNADFFVNSQRLFERIERDSAGYRRLVDSHSYHVRAYGFAYLNGEHCATLHSQLYAEMRATLGRIADPGINELFDLWNATMRLRDQAMVKNIRQYCSEANFEKAVLLVGAAHRRSIIDASEEQPDGPARIHFDLS